MSIAQVINSVPREVTGTITLEGGSRISADALEQWSEPQRNAVSIYTINEPIIPEGLYAVESQLEWTGSQVNRLVTLSDPPRRLVPKSDIQDRLDSIGKLLPVYAALQSQPRELLKWQVANHPNVYFDDPAMLAVLAAVGCTPEQIAMVTA